MPIGQKVSSNKNFSNGEQLFGIDGPQNVVTASSPGGKKQFSSFGGGSSSQNLLSGGYGVDRNEAPVTMKPYSKHTSGIPKPY